MSSLAMSPVMNTRRDASSGRLRRDPVVNIGAIDATGRAHVGDDAEKVSGLEAAQAIGAGLAAHDRIAAALENGAHIAHDGRLILDQQHGQADGFCGKSAHG